jgi:hypothetical protein
MQPSKARLNAQKPIKPPFYGLASRTNRNKNRNKSQQITTFWIMRKTKKAAPGLIPGRVALGLGASQTIRALRRTS